MPYYKRIITAGDVKEIEYYYSVRTRGKTVPKSTRIEKSSEKQEERNKVNREKHLSRLINNNFTSDDLYITLTYTSPTDRTSAIKDFEKLVNRINYKNRKQGKANIKYIKVTEGGNNTRIHHHAIISGTNANEIIAQWAGRGIVKIVPLYEHDRDYTELARYLLKEKRAGNFKHWTQSRGLKPPQIEYKTASKRDIKAIENGVYNDKNTPKGYMLVRAEIRFNDITGLSGYYKYIRTQKKNVSDSGTFQCGIKGTVKL